MCETIRPRLTAYLDGELADEHGSVVRGHLRECATCRQIARDEAALRDGLRMLPPIDPPATLWSGIQAQLAAAEVADAHRPRWRRAIARWLPGARWVPTLPQLAAGSVAAAAAVALLTWRAHRADELPGPSDAPPRVAIPASPEPPRQPHPISQAPVAPSPDDVTADLIAEPARATASYAQVIDELMSLAASARTGWTDEQKAAFDATVAGLRTDIARAAPGRPQQRAQRALIRALQRAVIRDEIVLASGGPR